MDKFHKNLNKMALFTTLILIVGVIFWRTFMNIAVSNIILNGIIIGVGIFGICLCFISMFRLLPEYKWMNAYFNGKVSGISPVLLRPVALVLNNKHTHITTSNLTELLDLVSLNMENERDYIRYITNTLIFLGLLGTFWGLIVTVGGFAELLTTLNFEDESVLTTMQMGMAKPLAGMATAFTSSLLGLGSSLIVGFLANQLQNTQNNIFQEITHFMSIYVVQTPNKKEYDVYSNAPVTQPVYTNISDIYDAFTHANYEIKDIVRIDGVHPALIALGTNEQLLIATNDIPVDVT
ncbi:MAG: MotA/TolQ/ExbB proton channel family protein, partial [Alphaproteobacteria bacterium]|nr:MotA/TolQ/ExbB proton channel family protein [Alphaproteobacteria bacterium]